MRVGAELLLQEHVHLIRGKRLGVVTNHSAILSNGRHLVDVLAARRDVQVTALFGPEHGIRGQAPDRRSVRDQVDLKTGIPVYSLFGSTYKPTRRMLKDVDLLLFDIQDVGARFYTYTSTLALTMEAAAEIGIPYVVLDRPNPIGGELVEGPIREERLKSFVGWLPIPIIHGLTVGEIARMINGEFSGKRRCTLKVVKMKGWKRSCFFDQTGLSWVNPSPSIRSLHTAIIYPGTCLIEGTNVSEGRGTDHPFEQIGAPWIDGRKLAFSLRAAQLPGVSFHSVRFTPRSARKVTTDPKFEGIPCQGIRLRVSNPTQFHPVHTGVVLLEALQTLFPGDFLIKQRRFDELAGTRSLRTCITKGLDPLPLLTEWEAQCVRFRTASRKYHLYK